MTGKVKILGKIKSFKGSLKVYRLLTKGKPKVYNLDRQVYYDIVRDYHEVLSDIMIEKGHDFFCPKWMGTIMIRKFMPALNPVLDFREFNKSKKVEFIDSNFYDYYQAKWCWKRITNRIKNIAQYSFRPSFTNKRRVSKEVQYNSKDKVYTLATKSKL